MHIRLRSVLLPLGPVSDLQVARLVVRAVAAGDEFLVFALEREPRFEIVLFGRGVVERAGDYRDDAVRDVEGLVELFGVADHQVEELPGLLRLGDDELFDLRTGGGGEGALECTLSQGHNEGGERGGEETFSNWCTRKIPQASFPCAPASRL